jgi:hypothetical protein
MKQPIEMVLRCSVLLALALALTAGCGAGDGRFFFLSSDGADMPVWIRGREDAHRSSRAHTREAAPQGAGPPRGTEGASAAARSRGAQLLGRDGVAEPGRARPDAARRQAEARVRP